MKPINPTITSYIASKVCLTCGKPNDIRSSNCMSCHIKANGITTIENDYCLIFLNMNKVNISYRFKITEGFIPYLASLEEVCTRLLITDIFMLPLTNSLKELKEEAKQLVPEFKRQILARKMK